LRQHAQAEADVLEQGFDEAHAPGVAAFFFHLLDAAEAAQCCVTSLFRAHPRRDVLLDLFLEMERQFLGEFLVEFLFAEQLVHLTE
jgi:hypothetical protein